VTQQQIAAYGSLRRQLQIILLIARFNAIFTAVGIIGLLAACIYFRMHGRPFASLAMALLVGIIVSLRLPRRGDLAEDEPSGVYLHEDEAPELFALVYDASAKFKVRVPDVIYLGHTCDLFLGFHNGSRYLYLGLPLLYSMDSEQFSILLSLAIARSAGCDAKLLARAERVQRICSQWKEKSRGNSGTLVRLGFAALLSAYSNTVAGLLLRLERLNEIQAFAQITRIVSQKHIGKALVRAALAQRCFHDLWSDVCLQLQYANEPHRRIYTLFASDLKQRMLQLNPSVVRDLFYLPDRCSSLAEQLLRLGLGHEQHFQLVAEAKSLSASCAAKVLLAEEEPELRSRMEEHWFAANSPSWEQLHHDMVEAERAHA